MNKDEFAGEGGSFVMENGVRRRVQEPTRDHPEGNAPRDADGNRLDMEERDRVFALNDMPPHIDLPDAESRN